MKKNITKKITGISILVLIGALLIISPSLAVQVKNPLGAGVTIPQFAGNIISAALGILGTISLAMVTYGGFLLLTSAGRPNLVEKGRKVFTWSFFGLLVIFGSYAFTSAVLKPTAGISVEQDSRLGGAQNGCEQRGANWACINSFCNEQLGLEEYAACVATFNQTNSDIYTSCVPGGPLCGSATELCCQIR